MTFVTTKDGTQIFYKDWGPKNARPLVFHHGWPLSSDDWDTPLLFFVAQGFRGIAHDRRGHGRISDAAPKVCLYTPLRSAVLEDEKDGSTWVLYDNPESLMGSFCSSTAQKIGSSLNQKIIKLVEEAL